MKKTIIVLFLLVTICLLPTACKKEKKSGFENVSTTIDDIYPNNDSIPQLAEKKVFSNNGFLFTASERKIKIKHPESSSYSLIYLDLITKEKKEIKNLTSFSPHRTIISPDRKYFIMFFIKIDATGQKRYDLYTMKADGSYFQCVSEKLGINDLAEYGNSYPQNYGFSPDFQSIILTRNSCDKFTQKQIYVISLDGSSYQHYKEGDESFPALYAFLQGTSLESYDSNIQDFAYRNLHHNLKIKTWDFQQQVFLLAIKNTLGLFSWKTMTYTPFYEHSTEISSCSMSPDKKYILFNEGFEKTFQVEGNLQIEKYAVFDVYCYSTDTKAIHKIITQEPIEDLSWLNNGYQFFYMNLLIEEDNLFNWHRVGRVLYFYDLHAMKSEKILNRCCIHTIDFFSKDLYITGSSGIDGSFPSIMNLSKKTIEDIHGTDDLYGYSYNNRIRIQNDLLYIFYTNGICSINPVNMKVQKKTFIKFNDKLGDNEYLELAFSPDDKLVCYKHDSYFSAFDFQGNELIQYAAPKDHVIDNIFFLNEHSIVYIESVKANGYPISSIYTSNLHFYSHKTKKTTKLTNEDWGRIKCYRLSPDQRFVAVVRVDNKNDPLYSYSIDCVSLVEIGKNIPITTFTTTETSYHHLFDDFTIQWSPDSQFLYYSGISSFTNEWTEENEKDGIPSVKCFSLKENKIWDNKSTEGCIYFNLSPNGKKFVLLSKDQDRIWIMDTNKIMGTNTGEYKQIGNQLDQSVYFFVVEWSLDSKKIVYMNNQNELFITDSEGNMLFKKDLAQTNNPLYKNINYGFLFPDHFFSPNNQEEVYIKQYLKGYAFNSQAILLLNLNQEVILEGTILDYQWSPDGKGLLLMGNKANEQFSVTHLKLYHTNDRTYTPLQFNLKKIMDACWSKDGNFVYAFGEDLETNQIILKRLNKNGEHLETVFVFGNTGTLFLGSLDGIEKIEQLEALK